MSNTHLRRLVIFVAAVAIALLPFVNPAANGNSANAASMKVTFLGGWGAGEQTDFKAILSYCDKTYHTQSEYQYAPNGDVGTELATRVQGGNAPDIAALSAPSQIAQYVQGNALAPITWLNQTKFKKQYSYFWRQLGTINGKLYAIYMKADVKSLVWYSPSKYKAGKYKIPKTWSDLLATSQAMVKKGKQPWAFGAQDGWTLTDFLENIMLNMYGTKVYNQWVKHQISWTGPQVKAAFKALGQIVANTKMIAGGRSRALGQRWDAAAKQMVVDPKAEFFQEATFVGAGLRTDLPKAKPGTSYNAFPFPSIKKFKVAPAEVGPNGIIAFNSNPGTKALVTCLTDPNALAQWAKLGGYISPNSGLAASAYPDPIAKMAAKMLANAGKANLVVGDASDLMPSALGSDYLFTELQKWFKNPSSTNQILGELETAARKDYTS